MLIRSKGLELDPQFEKFLGRVYRGLGSPVQDLRLGSLLGTLRDWSWK